jgi:4-amino-4-deoxy-L-arabinose transferase-like glycosyltransferase
VRHHHRFSGVAAPVDKPLPLWILYPLFFVAIYLSHLTLLRLPYFWDEAGYYIPAALDLFHTGALIPYTTLTNAHPPLPALLIVGWWKLAGCTIYNTRVLICMVSAFALLGAFRLARNLAGPIAAAVVTLLTALYPVWFAQSTLAQADIFAAAFTLWALSVYFAPAARCNPVIAAALFTLAALSKETAIVTPASLALWETVLLVTDRQSPHTRLRLRWLAALLFPVIPLACWYAFHLHRTGFLFGNPEYLRYNATANLGLARVLVALWHRVIHLTLHMNMYVPVGCLVAVLLMPSPPPDRKQIFAATRPILSELAVILMGNAVAFSLLGGALLTRYLLPMYPLVLLVCVSQWRLRYRHWLALAALSAAAFLAGIWINPPYAFAPEDNLTYRDMVVLHQQAVRFLETRYPAATVLTAWPATQELARPELGYSRSPIRYTPIENFSAAEIQKAAQNPGDFDTALIFSTKWAPPDGQLDLGRMNRATDARFFDFHRDLSPHEAATILHGEIVWQARRKGEWAAVLHFPRIVEARLLVPQPTP